MSYNYKFIKANREATKECIPKRTRAKKTLRSSDDWLKEARQYAQQALNQFEASNLENDKVVWTQAIQKLYQTYRLAEEEQLVRQIQTIETAHGDQKYGEAWRTVNEITGRNRAK